MTPTRASVPSIDRVYGSTWLTSGAGSVVTLSGQPGDPVIKLTHAKQPAEEVGPLMVMHDHDTGRSTLLEETDLVGLAANVGALTAQDAAKALFETTKPDRAQTEKARRRLEALTRTGQMTKHPGSKSTGTPDTYSPTKETP